MRASEERNSWVVAGIVTLLLLAHAVLAWLGREPGLLTSQDDARYLLLARSLAAGGYNDLFSVDQPWHSVYPPFYPAVLAAWGAVAGSDFTRQIALHGLVSSAALLVAYDLVRRLWHRTGALVALACMAVNPFLVARAGSIRSEPIYMLLTLVALWAFVVGSRPLQTELDARGLRGVLARIREAGTPRGWWLVAAATAAIAAALSRTIGVTLLGSMGLILLAARRYRAAAGFAVASLASFGAWLLWTVVSPDQVVGVHYFADLLETEAPNLAVGVGLRIADLAFNYAVGLPWVLRVPTLTGTTLDNLFWTVVLIGGLLAGARVLARLAPVIVTYLLAYASVILLWPYFLGRFLEPVVPLLVPVLLMGWARLAPTLVSRLPGGASPGAGRRTSLATTLAVGLVGVALVTGGASATVERIAVVRGCGRFTPENPPACIQSDRASYLRAMAYAGAHTPRDAVFLAAKPEPLFMYTGRQSVVWQGTLSVDRREYHAYLQDVGVDFVLLGSVHIWERQRILPRLAAGCEQLGLVEAFPPRTYLFRARRAPGDADACEALASYERATRDRDWEHDEWLAAFASQP